MAIKRKLCVSCGRRFARMRVDKGDGEWVYHCSQPGCTNRPKGGVVGWSYDWADKGWIDEPGADQNQDNPHRYVRPVLQVSAAELNLDLTGGSTYQGQANTFHRFNSLDPDYDRPSEWPPKTGGTK